MFTFPESPILPNGIVDAARDGSLVLFVGAGISRLVGCPTWNQFASEVLKQLTPKAIDFHEQKLISSISDPRKQLSLAKIIEQTSDDVTIDYDKIFPEDSTDPNNVYKYLNQFGCSFVTTNYDKFIKPELTKGCVESDWRKYKREDMLGAHLDSPGSVMHLHGSVDSSESMVITTKDYLTHYSSKEIPTFLKYLFAKKTVLFLGYGLEELEILEYVLKSVDEKKTKEPRLFILQGFFNAEMTLYEKLKSFYFDSFGARLIGFPLDHKSYSQQIEILKNWGETLKFGGLALIDAAALMEEELHEQ